MTGRWREEPVGLPGPGLEQGLGSGSSTLAWGWGGVCRVSGFSELWQSCFHSMFPSLLGPASHSVLKGILVEPNWGF